MLPDKAMVFKAQKAPPGGKKTKDLVFFSPAHSSEPKRNLFVMGTNLKPRCFSNVKSLPVKHRTKDSAWIASSLICYCSWELEHDFRSDTRKARFLEDNYSADTFEQVKVSQICLAVESLPPDTTSGHQPLDTCGVLSFEAHHRRIKVTLC